MPEENPRDDGTPEEPNKHWWSRLMISAVPALVSLGAAAFSTYSAQRASEQVDRLERHKIEREGQFKVYERVEGQLSQGQPYNLVIASAYVQLIEDIEIRRALCETIGSIAFSQLASNAATTDRGRIEAALRDVVRVARDCSEAMQLGRLEATEPSGQSASDPQIDVRETNATVVEERASVVAPVTEVVTNALGNPTGWDVDVFWCASQGDRSRELAARTAAQVAGASNTNRTIAGQALGRVRLRSVSADAQARLMPVAGNRVFGSADEANFAREVAAELNRLIPGAGFRYSRAAGITRWYISIFACGFAG